MFEKDLKKKKKNYVSTSLVQVEYDNVNLFGCLYQRCKCAIYGDWRVCPNHKNRHIDHTLDHMILTFHKHSHPSIWYRAS